MNVEVTQNALGRWYIQEAGRGGRGWSGSMWVDHFEGVGIVVQVSNFETEEEAKDYARHKGWALWEDFLKQYQTRKTN